jgi:hypothetical protein
MIKCPTSKLSSHDQCTTLTLNGCICMYLYVELRVSVVLSLDTARFNYWFHLPRGSSKPPGKKWVNAVRGNSRCLLWEPHGTHRYSLTGNTLRPRYRYQPVNAVWGKSRCSLWEPYGTQSSYLTGNTLRLRYRAQPVNAVWGKSRCLLWEPCGTHWYSPYLTGNTLRLRYRDQPVNAVWGNSRCLLWEPYGTHKYTVWRQVCALMKCKLCELVRRLSVIIH